MKQSLITDNIGTALAWCVALAIVGLVAFGVAVSDDIKIPGVGETGDLIVGFVVIPIGIALTFLGGLAAGALIAAWLLPAFDCDRFIASTGSTGKLAALIRSACGIGRRLASR